MSDLMTNLTERLYTKTLSGRPKKETFHIICDFVRDLEVRHLFRDANARTTAALLNDLLVQAGFQPARLPADWTSSILGSRSEWRSCVAKSVMDYKSSGPDPSDAIVEDTVNEMTAELSQLLG